MISPHYWDDTKNRTTEHKDQTFFFFPTIIFMWKSNTVRHGISYEALLHVINQLLYTYHCSLCSVWIGFRLDLGLFCQIQKTKLNRADHKPLTTKCESQLQMVIFMHSRINFKSIKCSISIRPMFILFLFLHD